MEPGVIPRVPLVVVAVPLSETVTAGSDAFDAMARLAVLVPALFGANVTAMFVLVPAASEYGRDIPLTVKPLPVTFAAEIVRFVPPVLEIVSDWVWLPPTGTLPRLILEGAFR
jgi:hypothetical protein